jgi:hypothetical protein
MRFNANLARSTWPASKEVNLLFYDEGECFLFVFEQPVIAKSLNQTVSRSLFSAVLGKNNAGRKQRKQR